MKETTYDICIIGAGPAGLASLSAVREPYSLDSLNDDQVNRANHSLKSHQYLKVCVIDIHDTWLHSWQKNFETLDIDFLRSPALAHPDLFDENALLAYAVANDRTDELLDSGCIDSMKLLAMGRPQTSLWKLPSTRLFVDFCKDLADSLSHDYIQGKVTSVTGFTKNSSKSPFRLEIDGGRCISAKAVILATGPTGRPIVPPGLRSLTHQQDSGRLLSWTRLDQVHPESDRILVVGGGLTAVQVALKLCKLGKKCVLCSRRPLIERHFDIGLEWFEHRTATKCMADFYHQDVADRLNSLKQARGGGSVPPFYMREVEKAEKAGSLVRMVGKVRCNELLEDYGHLQVAITKKNGATNLISVDQVVLACGLDPDCRGNPVVKNVLDSWPIPLFGGLPSVTEDLRWKKDMPLYVVGGLGGLNTGPDAGNLMGIRRAARMVANGLECRCWLRENTLVNPFEALLLGDSSDDDTSDESDTE